MLRRRLAFATPFVLVVGCRHPAPAAPREDEQTREDEAPVVVTLAEPLDAAEPDASEPVVEREQPIPPEAPLRVERPLQPAPEVQIRPRRECCVNPPAPRKVPIVRTEVQGAKIVIWIGTGTNNGVTVDNSAACVIARDDENRCDPKGSVTLTRCDKSTCIGTVELPLDLLKGRGAVRVRYK